jgi:hypothetical protein
VRVLTIHDVHLPTNAIPTTLVGLKVVRYRFRLCQVVDIVPKSSKRCCELCSNSKQRVVPWPKRRETHQRRSGGVLAVFLAALTPPSPLGARGCVLPIVGYLPAARANASPRPPKGDSEARFHQTTSPSLYGAMWRVFCLGGFSGSGRTNGSHGPSKGDSGAMCRMGLNAGRGRASGTPTREASRTSL